MHSILLAALTLLSGAHSASATDERADRARSAPASPERLVLERVDVHDPGVGRTAFSLLVPRGWKREGGVVWQFQSSNVASVGFRVLDPSSAAALEVFPVVPACWDESTLGASAHGRNYMGNFVYPPPRDALEYVRRYFVPGYRSNANGLRIGASTPLPDVEREVAAAVREPNVEKRVHAGKVRLEYEVAGTPIVEDVHVTVVVSRSPIAPTATLWSLEHQYSFRAEKERIDKVAPLLQTVAASVRLDLEWYAGYQQVLGMWRNGQMQSIRDAGELSRRISRNDDEVLASLRSSHAARQASQDRMAREFSESIRGVETYAQPFEGRELQLPSGYRDVWANARGEYVFSNDAGYDPNVGSSQGWKRLEPVR